MHFTDVPEDCVRTILSSLPFTDLLNARCAAKLFSRVADDAFFHGVAVRDWGRDFWGAAVRRPAIASRPTITWFQELLRIHTFQEQLDSLGLPRWRTEDFVVYWQTMDARVCK